MNNLNLYTLHFTVLASSHPRYIMDVKMTEQSHSACFHQPSSKIFNIPLKHFFFVELSACATALCTHPEALKTAEQVLKTNIQKQQRNHTHKNIMIHT